MRILLVIAPLMLAGLIAGVLAGDREAPEQRRAAEPPAPPNRAEPSTDAAVNEKNREIETAIVAEQADSPSGPRASAVAALRQSMEAGDPRTPPLATRPEQRDKPSAAELADPDLYRAYEARQKQQVYASFAAAASKKIADLEEMIALAGRGGVTAEQLAEAKRKVEKLREQRELLLRQYPGLKKEGSENQ